MSISLDAKKLVLARLESMPENLKMSIGGVDGFDKQSLIQEVQNETEIGKKIISMHLMYLRSFKK